MNAYKISKKIKKESPFTYISDEMIVETINFLLRTLKERKIEIRNWDNKKQKAYEIKKVKNKYYLLLENDNEQNNTENQ